MPIPANPCWIFRTTLHIVCPADCGAQFMAGRETPATVYEQKALKPLKLLMYNLKNIKKMPQKTYKKGLHIYSC